MKHITKGIENENLIEEDFNKVFSNRIDVILTPTTLPQLFL